MYEISWKGEKLKPNKCLTICDGFQYGPDLIFNPFCVNVFLTIAMGFDWNSAKKVTLNGTPGTAHIEYMIEELQPQSTYAVRIALVDGDGNIGLPGKESIIDTDSISCAPTSSSGCGCAVS
jgi:hypothetical protein